MKSSDGSVISQEELKLIVANDAVANHVVHRSMNAYLRNQRQGCASTKTRSAVRGGGKKPFTQKKTGNARRGTNRSPLVAGGGVLFGPKPRDWSMALTKK